MWVTTSLVVMTAALFAAYGYWLGSGAGPDASRAMWELWRWFLGTLGGLIILCAAGRRPLLLIPALGGGWTSIALAVWLTGVGEDWGITDPAHPVSMVDEQGTADANDPSQRLCPPVPSVWPERVPAANATITLGRDRATFEVDSHQAAICLDAENELPPESAWLGELRPSYAALAQAAAQHQKTLLPSIELIQGKAKQIDDGLVAAVQAHLAFGAPSSPASLEGWLRIALGHLEPGSMAHAWALGALAAAGRLSPEERRGLSTPVKDWVGEASQETVTGFYAWSDELTRTYRLFRYLQRPFPRNHPVPEQIRNQLRAHPELASAYHRLLRIQDQITNPTRQVSFDNSSQPGTDQSTVRFLPLARSHEVDAISAAPSGYSTMAAFIDAVRTGRIDLSPKPDSGLYDLLTYASEPLLLPDRAQEHGKVLFTPRYAKRLRHAFAALQAKHRDTFGISLASGEIGISGPSVFPRLRVEPAATHFVRMAEAHAELARRLEQLLSREVTSSLHGRKAGGFREESLAAELVWLEALYRGLYLIALDDLGIGVSGSRETDEQASRLALDWLANWQRDPDLSVDTRVAVKIADEEGGNVRVWSTLGVRGTLLLASYRGSVLIRPALPSSTEPRQWRSVYDLDCREYILPTDDFGEFSARAVPSRAQLVELAKKAKTRRDWERELSAP